ncbi:MAG: alpha/beta fold hydrolase [Halobacteriaceae archaeon]
MKLRTALAALAGGAGVATVLDRLRSAPPLPPALVGEQRTYRWRGLDIGYAEAGDEADPDLLLLHGIHAAASGQEFDRIWDSLADDYHVLAPDLPGFGRSERPPLSYTDRTYPDFIADFAADVTDDPIGLASSLTGAYAAMVGSDRFERLVLICPTDDTGTRRPWLRSLFRTPVVGELLFGSLTTPASLRWWGAREGYENPAALAEAEVDYQHRSARQPGARFAPASFIGGYLTPDRSLRSVLSEATLPVTLVWGREATRTPLAVGRGYAAAGDTGLVIVDDTRLLPHAERPAAFLRGARESGALPALSEVDGLEAE